MFRRKTSISVSVILSLVMVTTLLMAGAGVFSYRSVRVQMQHELQADLDSLAAQLAVALTLPAWNFDREQIQRVLEGALNKPNVERVRVQLADSNGASFVRHREDRSSDPGHRLLARRTISREAADLGTVEVEVTTRLMEADLRRYLTWLVLVIVAVEALLVTALFFFLWLTVLKPLREIEAMAVAQGTGDNLAPGFSGRSYRGELERLRSSLVTMIRQLRAGEARLRHLGDNLPDTMVYQVARETDGTMRFLYVSKGVERLHGVTAGEAMRDPGLIYRQFAEPDRAAIAAAEAESFAHLTVFNVTVPYQRPDGSRRWVQIRSRPERQADGRVVWDGIEEDITDRKLGEQELHRTNRALQALRQCNHALVHAADEAELLRQVCTIITEEGGHRLAWVGFAEQDEEKTVRVAAQAGAAMVYLESLKISWADTPRGRGPTGTAIRTGAPSTCRNFALDPQVAPWRDEALRHGLQSSVVFPLRDDEAVFGALCIYSTDRAAFEAAEFELLAELAEDLAYGISSRRIKAALRASEARYREAMHNSAIGMSIVDLEGHWLEVNPALCRILGYSREELLALNYQAITYPENLPASRHHTQRMIAGEAATWETEKRYRHKAGHTIWVQLSVALMRDAAARPLHFVSQTQDITTRKQAETALEAAAERLALALRASKFGLWRHNLQTRVSEWDARMFAIFGLPNAATIPSLEDILALVAEEDRALVRRSWNASPLCEHTYHIRFRVRWPDGKLRHIEMHGTVHDDGLGRPEWSIGVAGDITEIVQATAESERLRSQLLQSQKMETLGTLAAGVAHDFNNLLTGISGFVELASASVGPGHEAAELLKQARRGAMSARDLVRRILGFSRTNNENRRVRLNVVEMVRDTAPLIAATLPANISLSLAIECDAAPVLADSGQLQQILMNLCTNAAHAIGGKSGQLQLGVRLCELGAERPAGCAAGRHVRISIRDNGCGMSEETLKNIFEPFFTTKPAGEGTGLGLAIVHDIVQAHGGGLEVASAVGVGTTFALYLPATREEAALPAPVTADRPMENGTGQRILVVDDEPTVATVVRLTLQRSGYRPQIFPSPTDAWKHCEVAPDGYDLLIVDQNMPELNGADFIERVRRRSPALPVIMMSGRFENAASLAALRVDQIKKPFEITELLAAVKTALDRPPPPPQS